MAIYRVLISLLLLFTISCTPTEAKHQRDYEEEDTDISDWDAPPHHKMDCVRASKRPGVVRCENEEAVCYLFRFRKNTWCFRL